MGANSSVPATYNAPAYAIIMLDIVLTTSAVAGRTLSRRMMKTSPATDDYLAYMAYSANLGLLVSGLLLTAFGALDLNKVSVEDEEQKHFIRSVYNALAILYILSMTFIKLSILFLYQRTFTMFTTWFRYAWWAILSLVLLWTATCIILLALQGADKLPKGGFSRLGISITGVVNAASDVLILGLPAFMISRLKLQKKQKIALISIFLIGGIASLVSIVRGTIFLAMRADTLNEAYSNYLDIVLTATESSAGLMCVCLPLTKPIVVRITKCIQRWRGLDTGHQGWTTMEESRSVGKDKERAIMERADDYHIQLLPVGLSKGTESGGDTSEVEAEKGWPDRTPYDTRGPLEQRTFDGRTADEAQWETQRTWAHDRI